MNKQQQTKNSIKEWIKISLVLWIFNIQWTKEQSNAFLLVILEFKMLRYFKIKQQ